MENTYQLKGLDCANCAAKIEKAVGKIDGVEKANVDFMNKRMAITCPEAEAAEVETAAVGIIKKLEPDVEVIPESELKDSHGHQHGEGLNKGALVTIGITILWLLVLFIIQPTGLWRTVAFLAVYLLIGGDIVKKAISNILQGEVFDENFLMTVATVGAFAIGEYPEAVAVMLLYQIGEFFQDYAVDRSRRNIKDLMDVRPDTARILRGKEILTVAPEAVQVGDLVQVNPGEKIPLDGIVETGSSYIDAAALTGESAPVFKESGDEVLSGCINQEGQLTIRVTKSFGQSTVSKILDLVENASSQKAPAEKFITKFARYYTPVVVGLAVLLAVLPPLILQEAFQPWIYRALTFLVISCPCALVISVPLSFFAGIGGASRSGVLIKGANYLETLANVETVVFDKTGTLTEGRFAVGGIFTDLPEKEFLRLAAAVESHSNHPIAQSLVAAYQGTDLPEVTEMTEIPGQGVKGIVAGKEVAAGNAKLLQAYGLPVPNEAAGTIVYLIVSGEYHGYAVIADQIKPDAAQAIEKLQAAGIKETVMLTGDNQKVAAAVAEELGLSQYFAQLLPEDKVTHLQELLKKAAGKVAFVGDGINDAPVLATADIGIAMGGLGSDAAIEAADVVLMDDKPSKLAVAIKGARKTLRVVKQNIVFALAVKIVVLAMGAMGDVSMAAAVFADVGVTLIAVLNAMRCLQKIEN